MNIVVVLPGAIQRDPFGLANALADSVLARYGQQCTKPGAILHGPGPRGAEFRAHLEDRFRAIPSRRMLADWIADAYVRQMGRSVKLGAYPIAFNDGAVAPSPRQRGAQPTLMAAKQREWFQQPELREEVFGPTTTLISLNDLSELDNLPARGALAISVWFDPGDARDLDVVGALMNRHASAGRLIFNGPPTGVRVATSMVHGGPFPATNAPMGGTTAVGPRAIERWCRPICFQNCPDALLPPELQNANPRRIWRTLNGQPTQSPIP